MQSSLNNDVFCQRKLSLPQEKKVFQNYLNFWFDISSTLKKYEKIFSFVFESIYNFFVQ